MMKSQKTKTTLGPGHFVLRDSRCATLSRAGQEIGITLNSEYYVDIDSLLTTPVSHEEAKQYGKQLKLNLPHKKMLRLLAENQNVVNNSLLAIGRGDCLFLGDVTQGFWTSRSNNPKSDRRKVLFIKQVPNK
jgi:hypothetical protein